MQFAVQDCGAPDSRVVSVRAIIVRKTAIITTSNYVVRRGFNRTSSPTSEMECQIQLDQTLYLDIQFREMGWRSRILCTHNQQNRHTYLITVLSLMWEVIQLFV